MCPEAINFLHLKNLHPGNKLIFEQLGLLSMSAAR